MTIWTQLAGLDFALKTVDVAGVATRALQAGAGDDILFLHGTSGHIESFLANVPAHAKHFRVHAIDMIGHGYTAKPNQRYELRDYVRHVVNYMDAVGIRSAHVAGESLGGWVSAWLASEHPRRIRSLQMLCPGGMTADAAVMARVWSSTLNAVRSNDVALTRQRLELLMFDSTKVSDELVQVRHAIYHRPDFVANIENLLCLQDMETRRRNLLTPERLARIEAPALIVWGRENPFGPVTEAAELQHSIRGARLEVFPECGHWPQYEHRDAYDALSVAFCKEQAVAASAGAR